MKVGINISFSSWSSFHQYVDGSVIEHDVFACRFIIVLERIRNWDYQDDQTDQLVLSVPARQA